MLSNTQQLDLCQYMKEYENDIFFPKLSQFFTLLPLTTMQNIKCLAFLEVF